MSNTISIKKNKTIELNNSKNGDFLTEPEFKYNYGKNELEIFEGEKRYYIDLNDVRIIVDSNGKYFIISGLDDYNRMNTISFEADESVISRMGEAINSQTTFWENIQSLMNK